ncbi:hypothetical protein F4808DRAFT_442630 [Astrocystis sublimbata]|nr:hypothetical protein F4808DRAFT_442630 [Astrocystis sublimbata]
MDLLEEIESMARAAQLDHDHDHDHDQPHCDDIKRWESLFGFSSSQAIREIQDHRSNLSRPTVSDAHWEMVRAQKEVEGFNKEAYEYSNTYRPPKRSAIQTSTQNRTYLVQLGGPIDNPESLMRAARLGKAPPTLDGTDDEGNPTSFCKVDTAAKNNIFAYLSKNESLYRPTFVPYSIAAKELSNTSAYPELAVDTTMPQFRLSSTNDQCIVPAQNEFPVWYFFYGTLADPIVLGRLLGVRPSYKEASIRGGLLTTWAGKYKALIDMPGGHVRGSAFLVQSQDEEDALRCYETDKYEVVRCDILFEGKTHGGLTFRYTSNL